MPTSASVMLLALAAAGPAAASRLGASSKARITGSFLRAGMRPEIVARSLAKVEDEWKSQFRLYIECNATASTRSEAEKCEAAPKAFEHACGTIVSAVVQASNGDHTVVREYMDDICNEPELQGWRSGRCKLLATSVLTGMGADNYDNREHLNSVPLCQSFWTRFSTEEQELLRKESAEREAEEKRQEQEHQEQAKRAAELAAEEEKRRHEEEAAAEAAEAKQRADEEEARQRQEDEASRPAVTAGSPAEEQLKQQAEESAAKLQEKHEVTSNATVETEAANATAQNQVVANTSTDNKEAVNATAQAAATDTTSNASVQNTSQELAVANATANVSAQNVTANSTAKA